MQHDNQDQAQYYAAGSINAVYYEHHYQRPEETYGRCVPCEVIERRPKKKHTRHSL